MRMYLTAKQNQAEPESSPDIRNTRLLTKLGFRTQGVAPLEKFGAGDDGSGTKLEVEFLAVLDSSGEQVVSDQVKRWDLVPGATEFYVVRLHFVAVAADNDFFRAIPGKIERSG